MPGLGNGMAIQGTGASPAAQTTGQRWAALAFICLALLSVSLKNTSLNVGLPAIAKSLNASSSQLQWIIDAYTLFSSALLLTMGSVSDRAGRKRSFVVGTILFAIGSILAGLSTSVWRLTLTQAFMGIATAVILPSTLSTITATFQQPRERARAIAIWAAVFGLGNGLGPITSGWLLSFTSWNAIFFVNVPIMLVAIIGGLIFIRESKDEKAPPPDVVGVVLSIIGLLLLIFGIIEAGGKGWTDNHVLTALVIAAIFLTAFIVWEYITPHAMLPMDLFKKRAFVGANLSLTIIMFSMLGVSFALTQYWQLVLGYSAFQAGLAVLPLALLMTVMSVLSAHIAEVVGNRNTVTIALGISSLSLFYLSAVTTTHTAYLILLVGLLFMGAGLGLATSPATDSVMSSVPPARAGVGSAMNDTTRQLGGALGVAVLGSLLNSVYLSQLQRVPQLKLLPPEQYQQVNSGLEGAQVIATFLPTPQMQQAFLNVVRAAFVAGVTDLLFAAGLVMLLGTLLAYVILPHRDEPEQ
jgi:EmrB/QacA subfamily drug resistance transporter